MKKNLNILVTVLIFFIGGYLLLQVLSDTRTREVAQIPQQFFPEISTEYVWGKPSYDMFPDIVKPEYQGLEKAGEYLVDTDEVFVVKENASTFVYPKSIMSFHHIVNDVLDGKPVAITYCLLADVAVSFARGDMELGVQGPLYKGDLVMYDKKTKSSILQLTGQIYDGQLKGGILPRALIMKRMVWGEAKKLSNVRVLPPQKDMAFYKDFYMKRKDATVGVNSLTSKNLKVDDRLPPFTKGVGVMANNKLTYYPQRDSAAEKQFIDEGATVTESYWYVWAALYPQTRVEK